MSEWTTRPRGQASGIDWGRVAFDESNRQLARRLGVTPNAVKYQRLKYASRPADARSVPRGIDWDAQPLGAVPDEGLARRLGVSGPAVWRARKVRGIPACAATRRPCAGARQAASLTTALVVIGLAALPGPRAGDEAGVVAGALAELGRAARAVVAADGPRRGGR